MSTIDHTKDCMRHANLQNSMGWTLRKFQCSKSREFYYYALLTQINNRGNTSIPAPFLGPEVF